MEGQEYRWWKGFLIGFYVGVPVIIMGIFAAIPANNIWASGETALVMVAGWAIFPIQWARNLMFPDWSGSYPAISGGYCMLMVGAAVEKKNKQNEEARSERVAEAGKAKKK